MNFNLNEQETHQEMRSQTWNFFTTRQDQRIWPPRIEA